MDRREFMKITAAGASCLAMPASLLAWEGQAGPGDFRLVDNDGAAKILVDGEDFDVVSIASVALAKDIQMVTGILPDVVDDINQAGPRAIIIGTIEKSAHIRRLVESGRLDVSRIKGEWESFMLATVNAPAPGMDSALVVAGSDRRAAAFGAFEISRHIGVSPWVFWTDVRPEKKDRLIIKECNYKCGPPSVKYRGIFINDEDYGLQPWAANTYDPELGDIGPRTYEKVFELLLRLKANHLWPAMHACTKAFNIYPENKVVADRYAIVMGSAHCEQMLRNNVTEYDKAERGPYMYQINKRNILRYWEERVEENGKYENVYTLGMRAIHDSEMIAVGTKKQKVKLVEEIMGEQRAMLARHVNPDPAKVPQIFCPYKEMLGYYRAGLNVPDDVTLMWADDNHGYIRKLSNAEERRRSGGSGVYYHISYKGRPNSYLWLYTTPPALVWEEMHKAHVMGARRVWIVNVGDIKPAEIGTELFLQMAWDIDKWDADTQNDFLERYFEREFGEEWAGEIADLKDQFLTLCYRRRPEHMNFTYPDESYIPMKDPHFSLYNYGDEAQARIDALEEIEKKASNLYEKIPATKRDAYFQLILYPVRCTLYMNQKILYAFKSREYAKQGRTSANLYADMAEDAFEKIKGETRYYNEELVGGKWKYMMSWRQWGNNVFQMPKTGRVKSSRKQGLGVQVEGMSEPLNKRAVTGQLPGFYRPTARRHFIDLFNKGDQAISWKAETEDDWVKLLHTEGEIEHEQRIYVEVDYDALLRETADSIIHISSLDNTFEVGVKAFDVFDASATPGSFIQENGVVAINAKNFKTLKPAAGGESWKLLKGLGHYGGALMMQPVNMAPVGHTQDAMKKAARAEYEIHVHDPGHARLMLQAIPTHEINEEYSLVAGLSIDDGPIHRIEFSQGTGVEDEAWWDNVERTAMYGEADVEVDKGKHIVKLWGLDPSVIMDRIILDFGGIKDSYLGPPETRIIWHR